MNIFKTEIERGKLQVGTMLSELYSPNIPSLFSACGFDYFILDCEHGCFDYSAVAAMAGVARGIGFPMIVRIPLISRECITKYLDAGVGGLLVPMVETAEQAQEVVDFARYAPLGKRGLSTTRAHTAYSPGNLTEYMERANEEITLMIQIETRLGVENVTEIAAVKGIDGLMVGPNDLTSDMGIQGQLQHPEFKRAVKAVRETAAKRALFSGIITGDINTLKECIAMGMNAISCNSELGMIIGSARTIFQKIAQ